MASSEAAQASGRGITILGNLSIDRIDGGPPMPGGCPAFAAKALRALDAPGRIVTRLAQADRDLFSSVLDEGQIAVTALPAARTSSFALRYEGDRRTLSVQAIGDPWTPADIQAAHIDSDWVHVAPLLRGEFPPETLAALAADGRRVCYDGQGLVRPRRLGRVVADASYDPDLLARMSVLKLSCAEAQAVAGGPFDAPAARRLGVHEIVVTRGAGGCDLYVDGEPTHIAAQPVPGVNATGAGDMFMVAYAARRAGGSMPAEAAHDAGELVAALLRARWAGV